MIFQPLNSWLKIALYDFIIIIFFQKALQREDNTSTLLLLWGRVVASV